MKGAFCAGGALCTTYILLVPRLIRRKRNGSDVVAIRTIGFNGKLLSICHERQDAWSDSVHVHDLPAVDAVCHQTCSVKKETHPKGVRDRHKCPDDEEEEKRMDDQLTTKE